MPSFSEIEASAGERWQPEEGGEYTVVVVDVRKGTTQNDYPSINLWLEVVGEYDSGERFWDGTYFSASSTANGMAFAKIGAVSTSATREFFAGDPDEADIQGILMGSKFKVNTTYEANDRDPDKPWLRCPYIPLSDSSDIVDLTKKADPF